MHRLSFDFDFNDPDILKAIAKADYMLGKLESVLESSTDSNLLLNAVILGEAKESSEIENIVTTYDEIFKEMTLHNQNPASKEVINYHQAILYGYEEVKKNGFLSTRMIEGIHHIIDPNVGGIRKIPGTVILNTKTKEVLHTPPQREEEIRDYLKNLEDYINLDEIEDSDPSSRCL